jgi:hypothetical protein
MDISVILFDGDNFTGVYLSHFIPYICAICCISVISQ